MVWFLNKISGPLFNHLKKRGIIIFYWVLNDIDDFKTATLVNIYITYKIHKC